MPDHVPFLLTPATDVSTAKAVQFIKGGYSHAARKQSTGEIWHSGYFEHRIRDRTDFEAQKRYIAQNPVRANLLNHPHVHTADLASIDPAPHPLDGCPYPDVPPPDGPRSQEAEEPTW